MRFTTAETIPGPLVRVDRSISRQTVTVSLEFPEADFDECLDRREFRRRLGHHMAFMAGCFLRAWDLKHPPQAEEAGE